ncbi:MAG: hypothetical protein JWR90_1326 [Marmoricola sp.]|jgi:hypothetical protein|nr:hypothetical protein [Marmoricola sp.]
MPHDDGALPARTFGWSDMWLSPEDDPRQEGGFDGERELLLGYLRNYRLTLELKCAGLDAAQLARRSVPPSDLSLLGLVRHLATVEQAWFRIAMAGEDVPRLYRGDGENEFDDAGSDPAVVEESFARWREEVAFAEAYVDRTEDLATTGPQGDVLREVLLHMVEEYARHCGHADLLRERIDGRVGQ